MDKSATWTPFDLLTISRFLISARSRSTASPSIPQLRYYFNMANRLPVDLKTRLVIQVDCLPFKEIQTSNGGAKLIAKLVDAFASASPKVLHSHNGNNAWPATATGTCLPRSALLLNQIGKRNCAKTYFYCASIQSQSTRR